MSMSNYSAEEKTAIVLSLMGAELAGKIMEILPREIVQKIEDTVIPIMDTLELPEDIDEFILDNIIKDSPISKAGSAIDNSPELLEEEKAPIASESIEIEPDNVGDEALLELCPLEVVVKVIGSENKFFRGLLINIIPPQRHEEILKGLTAKNISIPANTQKTNIISNLEKDIFGVFITNLRNAWKKEVANV